MLPFKGVAWIFVLFIQVVSSLPPMPHRGTSGAENYHVVYNGVLMVKFPSKLVNCDDDDTIRYRNCSQSEIVDCIHYEEFGTYFKKLHDNPTSSTAEFRTTNMGTFQVKEHLTDRNYTLEIHGFNERIRFIAFQTQASDVPKWNLTLDMHSKTGRIMHFAIEDSPELKILFNFKHFLAALNEHSHGYHGNENSFNFNWNHAKLGVHTVQETYVNCQCILPGRNDEVPCDTRLESTTSAASKLPQNVVVIAWIVTSASVIPQQYLLW